MRVLVCGGRDYPDRDHIENVLDILHAETPIEFLMDGGARGVDTLAHWWAVGRRIPHQTFKANWPDHKLAAGPIRNALMLKEGKPDLVVAFPGGKGTADMVAKAERAGVRVLMPGWPRRDTPTRWGARP